VGSKKEIADGKEAHPEFSREMTKFYKDNKGASFEQARKHAAKLGYDEFSKGAHDRYRKEAGGKTQRAKARKAPAGGSKAPERCWMDLTTGKFCTDFDSGKPGTEVAIYHRVAMGTISLAYPPEEKGSLKA
jgi:hypothetical protein